MAQFDAVVVGAGPNGLAAAIVLARAGVSVLVLEGHETIGGGTRTAELTLPGFHHDVCATIHPMAVISPFFRKLPLDVAWIEPEFAVAHPLDDGTVAVVERSVAATSARLAGDARAYRNLIEPLVLRAEALFDDILGPLLHVPRNAFLLARFGAIALRSALGVSRRFDTEAARALFGGCAAHAIVPLHWTASASFALAMLVSAHVTGWPVARGGSKTITDALARRLRSLGGEIRTSQPVRSMRDVPPSRAIIFDVTARQLGAIAGDALPSGYLRRLQRFRYGPGVFKIDWALDGPIPWRANLCSGAATVHLGGTIEEIARYEAEIWSGGNSERPFVILAQQTLFDPTRAPAGKHTAWAYCHVPNGSMVDMTERIEGQVERFAPGFRDRILARHTMNAEQLELYNPNMHGGDIGGGANMLRQLVARPVLRLDPYATPNPRMFIGSSSTPPGGGVHGMCGYWAARSALRNVFKVRSSSD
jgi:phytoene dehydrogenase-like protein